VPSASAEVAEMLADEPPAIDFTQYTEVTITRRLYRDGTSHYLINKVPCRLRDVTDFFLGTGVGTKAYAIIEQGRIGQIVSSRPADRRLIIEEAAGITKFKSKKKAAEKKLEQTKQNLLRISDIVAELDKRMGTLRRQAQKAERYRQYKQELRDLDLWKASHRFLELRAETTSVSERLTEAETDRESGARRLRRQGQRGDRRARRARARGAPHRHVAGAALRARQPGAAHRVEDRLPDPRGQRARRARHRRRPPSASACSSSAPTPASISRRATAELEGLAAEVAAGEAGGPRRRRGRDRDASSALAESQSSLDRARGQVANARAEEAKAEAQAEALVRRREESDRRLARVTDELAQVASGCARSSASDARRRGDRDAAPDPPRSRQPGRDLGGAAASCWRSRSPRASRRSSCCAPRPIADGRACSRWSRSRSATRASRAAPAR
jgi:chromosome segregation protein